MVRVSVAAWRLSKMCSGQGKHTEKIVRVIVKEDVKLPKGVVELRMHPDNASEFSRMDPLEKPKMRIFDAVCKLTVGAELSHLLLALPALREALKTLTPFQALDYLVKKEGEMKTLTPFQALDYLVKKEGERWDPTRGYTQHDRDRDGMTNTLCREICRKLGGEAKEQEESAGGKKEKESAGESDASSGGDE